MPTKDELLQRLTEIGTCEDDAQRRNLILAFQTDVGSICDDNDRLTTTNATLDTDNKQLREYNMKLFLSVGQPAKQTQQTKTETDTDTLRYENLFNEKGDLK